MAACAPPGVMSPRSAQPPEGAEEQRHDDAQQGDITQAEGIAGREPQIGVHRPRLACPDHHPRLVSIPQRASARITVADSRAVAKSLQRLAFQRRIQPLKGILTGGKPQSPQPENQQRQRNDPRQGAQGPDRLHRQGRDHPQHYQCKPGQQEGPQRPQRHAPRSPPGCPPVSGPAASAAGASIGCIASAQPCSVPKGQRGDRTTSTRVALSRLMISSKEGLSRMTAN